MIANARWGSYGPEWPIAHPTRSVGPEYDGITTHIGSTPLVGLTNDENAQRATYPSANASNVRDPARVATSNPTFYLRPMHWRRYRFDGSHGVVRSLRPGTWTDRQTPLRRPVRTLRSAPSVPWDVGTALGPAGHSTGSEE